MTGPRSSDGRSVAADLTTDELLNVCLEMAHAIPLARMSRPDLALASKASEYLLALDHLLRTGSRLPRAWRHAQRETAALHAENAALRTEVETLRSHIHLAQQQARDILDPPTTEKD